MVTEGETGPQHYICTVTPFRQPFSRSNSRYQHAAGPSLKVFSTVTKQPHRYPAGLDSLWDSGPEKTSCPETSERSRHWPVQEDACLDHRGADLAFPAPTLPCVSEASQLGPLSLATRLEMVTLGEPSKLTKLSLVAPLSHKKFSS